MPARSHGFHRPFHPLQVTSWVFFAAFVIGFAIFFAPALQTDAEIGLGVLYFAITLFVVVVAAKTTSTDPIDPSCPPPQRYRDEQFHDREKRRLLTVPDKQWCPYCNDHVFLGSKHCRLCDKCVATFDHHCKWLNNCVGEKNYTPFILSVVSVLVLVFYQAAVGVYVFVQTYNANDVVLSRANRIFSDLGASSFRGILGVYIAVTFIFGALLCHLLGLHIYLHIRGLTTYEWIISRRAQQRIREEMERLADETGNEASPQVNAQGQETQTIAVSLNLSPALAAADDASHTHSRTGPHSSPPLYASQSAWTSSTGTAPAQTAPTTIPGLSRPGSRIGQFGPFGQFGQFGAFAKAGQQSAGQLVGVSKPVPQQGPMPQLNVNLRLTTQAEQHEASDRQSVGSDQPQPPHPAQQKPRSPSRSGEHSRSHSRSPSRSLSRSGSVGHPEDDSGSYNSQHSRPPRPVALVQHITPRQSQRPQAPDTAASGTPPAPTISVSPPATASTVQPPQTDAVKIPPVVAAQDSAPQASQVTQPLQTSIPPSTGRSGPGTPPAPNARSRGHSQPKPVPAIGPVPGSAGSGTPPADRPITLASARASRLATRGSARSGRGSGQAPGNRDSKERGTSGSRRDPQSTLTSILRGVEDIIAGAGGVSVDVSGDEHNFAQLPGMITEGDREMDRAHERERLRQREQERGRKVSSPALPGATIAPAGCSRAFSKENKGGKAIDVTLTPPAARRELRVDTSAGVGVGVGVAIGTPPAHAVPAANPPTPKVSVNVTEGADADKEKRRSVGTPHAYGKTLSPSHSQSVPHSSPKHGSGKLAALTAAAQAQPALDVSESATRPRGSRHSIRDLNMNVQVSLPSSMSPTGQSVTVHMNMNLQLGEDGKLTQSAPATGTVDVVPSPKHSSGSEKDKESDRDKDRGRDKRRSRKNRTKEAASRPGASPASGVDSRASGSSHSQSQPVTDTQTQSAQVQAGSAPGSGASSATPPLAVPGSHSPMRQPDSARRDPDRARTLPGQAQQRLEPIATRNRASGPLPVPPRDLPPLKRGSFTVKPALSAQPSRTSLAVEKPEPA